MTRLTTLWAHAGARLYDPFLALGERRGMRERRRSLLAGAHGRVLEIGAGTGLNLPHYSDAVFELVLVEPEPGMRAKLSRRAAGSARVVGASAEALPFPDASFDCVVSTMVLCTVDDVAATLSEVRRVLRPGGRLLFVEHVRSDAPGLARRQDRLAAAWHAFGSGCRCNQPTLALLAAGGLRPDRVQIGAWRGMPRIVHPLVAGHATVTA
jgi:ubiquinone/menaquinone biosynthesis C-methylase UbiE